MTPKPLKRYRDNNSILSVRWVAMLTFSIMAMMGVCTQVAVCFILVVDPHSNRMLSLCGLYFADFTLISTLLFFSQIVDFLVIKCRVNKCGERLRKMQLWMLLRKSRRN